MYVKDIMSKDVTTIDAASSISEALDIMSSHSFHRLPVVDDEGNLIGLLSESVITSNTPNNASSLSVYELNYLLNKLKVEDIMIKDVITISPDDLLEKAAVSLRENDIGCLPVTVEGKLVGIITHNDIFEAFIDLLGYHQNGVRFVVNIQEDKPGILESIARCFHEENISISNLAVYTNSRGIEVVVVAQGEESIRCKKTLEEAGYRVTDTVILKG